MFIVASAALGALIVQLAVVRLTGHLWSEQGGPLRSRRILVVVAHAFPPAVVWVGAATVQGWGISPSAIVTTVVVLAGALVGGWAWVPHSPLRLRPGVGWGRVLGVAAVGLLVFGGASWLGASRRGHATALVWGLPRDDEQRADRDGRDPAHAAPRPENTAGAVRARILRSSQSDQWST